MSKNQHGCKYQPVAICGCGGAGTSYVAKVLRHCGLYLGSDAGDIDARKYHESRSMKEVNNVLYRHYGFCFDGDTHYLANDADANIAKLQDEIANKPKKFTETVRNLKTGLAGFSVYDALDIFWRDKQRDVRWGWKDPKNSIMLPFWKVFYPDLKILVIQKKVVKNIESRSSEGAHFRRMTPATRKAHMEPVGLTPYDDALYIDFDEFCTKYDVFKYVLEWAGLEHKTEQEYENLLLLTGLEKDRLKKYNG